MTSCGIGIDLGTTTSCVTIHRNNCTDIIKVNGERVINSKIYYDIKNGATIVGNFADRSSAKCIPAKGLFGNKNLIIDSKRFIGRYFDDPIIQEIRKNYDFEIENNEKNEIKFLIRTEDRDFKISPEEASSEILKSLKKSVCTYLGIKEDTEIEAVITVPAYFTIYQRKATSKAAELARIKVLKLLNEPTAAAIKHLHLDKKTKINLMVFDFGGGTLDISLIKIDDKNNLQVLATYGDSYLGGRNIDEIIFKYLVETYGKNVKNISKIKKRLETDSENMKVDLSQQLDATCDVLSEFDIEATITRELFDTLNDGIYKKCLSTIDKCIKQQRNINIDEILLVGGSSQIPKLEELIINKFPNCKIIKSEDRSEVVSCGAAIQAAIIKNVLTEKYNIHDIINISIGYETFGEEMNSILKKNSNIPCAVVHEAVTIRDNQNTIILNIYEGERKWVRYNNFLGSLRIENIPPNRSGTSVKITFHVDLSGELKVTTNLSDRIENQKISLTAGEKPKPIIRLDPGVDTEIVDERFTKFVKIKTAVFYCCQYFLDQSDIPKSMKTSIDQLKNIIINTQFDINTSEALENKVNNLLEKINCKPLSRHIERNLKRVL